MTLEQPNILEENTYLQLCFPMYDLEFFHILELAMSDESDGNFHPSYSSYFCEFGSEYLARKCDFDARNCMEQLDIQFKFCDHHF
jgi:hypothetical protein